jgi:hypothetical protein
LFEDEVSDARDFMTPDRRAVGFLLLAIATLYVVIGGGALLAIYGWSGAQQFVTRHPLCFVPVAVLAFAFKLIAVAARNWNDLKARPMFIVLGGLLLLLLLGVCILKEIHN